MTNRDQNARERDYQTGRVITLVRQGVPLKLARMKVLNIKGDKW